MTGVDKDIAAEAARMAEEVAPLVAEMDAAAETKELVVEVADFSDEQRSVERRIIHCLTYYPGLSGVMLQMGLGPQITPGTWRPVLYSMQRRGIIVKDDVDVISPAGRYKTLYRYRLASTPRESLDIAQKGHLASYTPA